jgi:hypothetical protein
MCQRGARSAFSSDTRSILRLASHAEKHQRVSPHRSRVHGDGGATVTLARRPRRSSLPISLTPHTCCATDVGWSWLSGYSARCGLR